MGQYYKRLDISKINLLAYIMNWSGSLIEDFRGSSGESGETRQPVGRFDAGTEVVDELGQHPRAQVAASLHHVANSGD